MNELVIKGTSGQDVTTSLLIADVFGKQHDKVVRDIEALDCSPEFNAANFGVISYKDSMNRERKAYEITKDGFSFLVMGYTGEKAAKFKEDFIGEFNKREAMLKDPEYILEQAMSILHARTKRLEESLRHKEVQVELQEKIIKEQAPSVQYVEEVLQAKNTWTITTITKELGKSAMDLNRILKERQVQFKRDGHWVLYAKYQDQGFMKTRTYTFTKKDGSTGTNIESVWTEKGRKFLHDLFKEELAQKEKAGS